MESHRERGINLGERSELAAAEYAESPEKRRLYEIMLRLEDSAGESE